MSGYLTINQQKIAWSFVAKVKKALGDDHDRTIDCFWKARNAKDIVRYVSAGFRVDEKGNRYSLLPSAERENGQFEKVRKWWRSLYVPHNRPLSMADIMRSIVDGGE